MVVRIINLIIVFNFIILLGLIVGLRRMQKGKRLTANKMALILAGYLSFSFITPSIPLITINKRVTLIVDIIFLLIIWPIGYPWIRWLYNQFTSMKR